MKRKASWLAVIGVLGAAVPAAGQSGAPSHPVEDDTTIVVTGEKADPPSRGEVAEQAQELSRVGRYQLYDEALPRFETPPCPAVLGLRDDYAAEMTALIRANAARLGVRRARPGCSPNLFIAFVDDGQALVSNLAQKHPDVFCIIGKDQQAELLRDGEPVRVWSYIRTIDIRRTGAPVRISRCREEAPSQGRKAGSDAMFLPESRNIISALVVFDRDAALGMSVVQLADYATMRGLSHTRPANGNERLETILSLFDGDHSSPPELTSFDVGYLEALYSGPPNQRAMTRFVGIKRRLDKTTAGTKR